MTAPKPIVKPGPSAQGPPGWEEKQQQRLSSGTLTNQKQSSNYHDDAVAIDNHADTGYETVYHDPADTTTSEHPHKEGIKEKLHHLGEKLALVPPQEKDEHGNPLEFSAHRQVRLPSSLC